VAAKPRWVGVERPKAVDVNRKPVISGRPTLPQPSGGLPRREGSQTILCVLAGGRSRRFGGSKLNIQLNGVPLLHWQARRLGAAMPCERWLSVAPAAQPLGGNAFERWVTDPAAFGGPLVAMSAVLAAAHPGDAVVFAAADMPLVSPACVRALVMRLRQSRGAVAVMGRWSSGPDAGLVEPFPSAWRVGPALAMVRQALAAGVRGPHRLASRRGVVCVPLGWPRDAEAFLNVNRPEDLDALRARVGGVRAGDA
jgi:molybdenum cofactor guanylyltransferase